MAYYVGVLSAKWSGSSLSVNKCGSNVEKCKIVQYKDTMSKTNLKSNIIKMCVKSEAGCINETNIVMCIE